MKATSSEAKTIQMYSQGMIKIDYFNEMDAIFGKKLNVEPLTIALFG